MKLRDQIFVLLALPLACQLVTVGIIIASSARVDEIAKHEAKAKKIIAICEELDSVCGHTIFELSMPRQYRASDVADQLPSVFQEISTKGDLLKELTSDNKVGHKRADHFIRVVHKLMQNIEDFGRSYHSEDNTLFYSQYLDRADYLEMMRVLVTKMSEDRAALIQIYGEEAKDFSPAEISARQGMRNSFVLAILANVTIVACLAVVIHRQTLTRLGILMSNMKHFARGDQIYQNLQGSDEIAELDKEFAEVSKERNRLEEIRKSMRAMVSHDLRSPLSSILINVQMLLESEVSSPKSIRILKRVFSETERLSRLANTLLDIEKIEDGKLDVTCTPLLCLDIVTSSVAVVQPQLDRKQLKIIENLEEDLYCLADKDKAIQVLVNFLSNAGKFAPARSTIRLNAFRNELTEKIRFEVIDEGPGVPSDKVANLFNKFSQLEQSEDLKKTGSGLGLYICKMLTAAQNGTVGFAQPENPGSCFWFELPAAVSTGNGEEEGTTVGS